MTDMNIKRSVSRFGIHRLRGVAGFPGLWLAVILLSAGCASVPAEKPVAQTILKDDVSVVEKLGIKPVAIRLSGAGTIIDFRYSVLDSKKSLPMFNRKLKTFLVEQSSGQQFSTPADSKLGPLRSSSREPLVGREYFIFFKNAGGSLKRGSKVAVVVGDSRIENLTIE